MSVRDNASLSALPGFSRHGHIQAAHERDSVAQYVGKMRVRTPSLAQTVGLLSGGNQQKIAIAKGLMTRPRVLILDEPTRGVDVGAKFEIYRIIRQLAAEGTAILLVSSELPELLGLSDRIVVMHEGRVNATLAPADFNPQTIMAAATGQHHAHA